MVGNLFATAALLACLTLLTRFGYTVSHCAYHDEDRKYIGAIGSRQPAIWMGDYGFATIFPGRGLASDAIEVDPERRGWPFTRKQEYVSAFEHDVLLSMPSSSSKTTKEKEEVEDNFNKANSSQIFVRTTGASRAAMLEYRFDTGQDARDDDKNASARESPYLVVQASRPEWRGSVYIDEEAGEISGWNSEQMDYRLGPNEALGFKGYFVYSFEYQQVRRGDKEEEEDVTLDEEAWQKDLRGLAYGTMFTNSTGVFTGEPQARRRSNDLGTYAFVRFPSDTSRVRVRVGMSMIDIAQARRNMLQELGRYATFDEAVAATRLAWREKVDQVQIQKGGTEAQRRIVYTAMLHSLQYPAEHAEPDDSTDSLRYYSPYLDDTVSLPRGSSVAKELSHGSMRYQSYSIWDTFRAEMGFLILFEPRRVVDMLRSMLDMYDEGGFLPMWSTGTGETNIMIGTHADSVLAEALVKGVGIGEDIDVQDRLDTDKIWEAVLKDANQPPPLNDVLRFADREEFTPYEVRAGLNAYDTMGFVPLDRWDESTSRTLDYAYDDAAVAVVGRLLNKSASEVARLEKRSRNYRNVFDNSTGRMAARFSNGTFLSQPLDKPTGRQLGFTEGNEWDYSFDVMHDVEGLAELVGGKEKLIKLLDEHFEGGHNDQSNEPSHHIPYLYAMLGDPASTQRRVRSIAAEAFSDTPDGYAGNEDCGQQSAWYWFTSVLGVYPVSPISGEYIVGSPFFDRVEIQLPSRRREGQSTNLTIVAPGAGQKQYVRSLKINGKKVTKPVVTFPQIVQGGLWEYEMSEEAVQWNV